jgi:O-antigen/teichoic acid export membrane protein
VVTALVGLYFVKKTQPVGFVWDTSQMLHLWKTAVPLGVMLLFDVIYFRADNIILTIFRSTTEVGAYGFAYKLFEFPLVFPTFFMNAVYPLMIRNSGGIGDREHIRILFRKSAAVTFGISLLCLMTGWVGAPYISLVNEEFYASVEIFRILCLGLPVFFVTGVTLWTLIALKKQGTMVWIYACVMILNIACNYVLIPTYGSIAAAWVTVGSETFVLLCSLFLLHKEIRL